ncbi:MULTISPECIES: GNAT family N-acetyltransferase [Clostridia]|uniref:GNAT family N-acetyltransferase n=1 Tax=Clostridia TaxID=186801 RepID=UPI0018F3A0D1|nr:MULTISPECIES: GNAT family N-acetyltransferase [Clostridia]
MVVSSGVYDCSTLDGFTFINDENKNIGLITFIIKGKECEIISLDSIEEGKGIGSSLVQEVEKFARKNKCKFLKIITTNDNLLALKFYQKRGFRLSQIMVDAVPKGQKVKTRDPLKGK